MPLKTYKNQYLLLQGDPISFEKKSFKNEPEFLTIFLPSDCSISTGHMQQNFASSDILEH